MRNASSASLQPMSLFINSPNAKENNRHGQQHVKTRLLRCSAYHNFDIVTVCRPDATDPLDVCMTLRLLDVEATYSKPEQV